MGDTHLHQMYEHINNGLRVLADGERFQRFLLMAKPLASFSPRNQILILEQNKHASDVRSFEDWKGAGRYVKYQERGISIIRPNLVKVKMPQQVTGDDGTQKTEYTVVEQLRYSVETVFDVSQTENDAPGLLKKTDAVPPPPDLLYTALTRCTPYRVKFERMHDSNFQVNNQKKEIVLRLGMGDDETLHSLLKALIEQQHPQKSSRERAGVLLLVSHGLALLSDSFDIVGNLDCTMESPEAQLLEIDRIQSTAARMERCIRTEMGQILAQQKKGLRKTAKKLDLRLEAAKQAAAARSGKGMF